MTVATTTKLMFVYLKKCHIRIFYHFNVTNQLPKLRIDIITKKNIIKTYPVTITNYYSILKNLELSCAKVSTYMHSNNEVPANFYQKKLHQMLCTKLLYFYGLLDITNGLPNLYCFVLNVMPPFKKYIKFILDGIRTHIITVKE